MNAPNPIRMLKPDALAVRALFSLSGEIYFFASSNIPIVIIIFIILFRIHILFRFVSRVRVIIPNL